MQESETMKKRICKQQKQLSFGKMNMKYKQKLIT